MASKDFEDGVWRTIGGRRIFIRDGESLSSAMKKSGKFKSKNQKDREAKEEEMKEARKKLAQSYSDQELEREIRDAKDESRRDELKSELQSRKEGKSSISETKVNDKFKNAPTDIQKNVSDFEKVGVKVEDAFETDLYGNGKETRFMIDDNKWIAHTTESFGQKEDTWSVNELKNGNIESKSYKSYDDMIKNIGGSKGGSDKYSEYYKKENLGEPSNYKKGDQIEFSSYYSTIKGSIVREATDSEKKYHINSNLKGYIVRDSNGNEHVVADTRIKGRGETDKAYKKAFEEYKKKHPNTKLSYGQFVDISEGKK